MSAWHWLRGRRDRDLEEEIASHLRMAAHDSREKGASAGDAEAQGGASLEM